ncbi:MAG: hypothetical protein V1835_00590 [Candidatus Micrarchaeota archaeon]
MYLKLVPVVIITALAVFLIELMPGMNYSYSGSMLGLAGRLVVLGAGAFLFFNSEKTENLTDNLKKSLKFSFGVVIVSIILDSIAYLLVSSGSVRFLSGHLNGIFSFGAIPIYLFTVMLPALILAVILGLFMKKS